MLAGQGGGRLGVVTYCTMVHAASARRCSILQSTPSLSTDAWPEASSSPPTLRSAFRPTRMCASTSRHSGTHHGSNIDHCRSTLFPKGSGRKRFDASMIISLHRGDHGRPPSEEGRPAPARAIPARVRVRAGAAINADTQGNSATGYADSTCTMRLHRWGTQLCLTMSSTAR